MTILRLWALSFLAGMTLSGLVTDLYGGHYLANYYRPSVPDLLTCLVLSLVLASVVARRNHDRQN